MLLLEKILARLLWLTCRALDTTSEDVERARAREAGAPDPKSTPEHLEA